MQVCASFRDQPAIPFYVSGIQVEHSPERRDSPQATHRVHNCSTAAYGRIVDSACTAEVLSGAIYVSTETRKS